MKKLLKTKLLGLICILSSNLASIDSYAIGQEGSEPRLKRENSLKAYKPQAKPSNKEKQVEIVIAGTSHGGGGVFIKDRDGSVKVISQLAVWHENLVGWSEVVEPKLKKIDEKLPYLARLMRSVAKQTYWFVLPGTLVKLSASTQGLPFTNYFQDAINSNGQVFIAGHVKRSVEESGNLLFHELVMSTLFRHPYYNHVDQIQLLHKDTAKLEVEIGYFIDRFSDREIVQRIQNITPIFKRVLSFDELANRALSDSHKSDDENQRQLELVREYDVLTAFNDLRPMFSFELGPKKAPLSAEEQLRQDEEIKQNAIREAQVNEVVNEWTISIFNNGNLVNSCSVVNSVDSEVKSPSGFEARSDYKEVARHAWRIRDHISAAVQNLSLLSFTLEEDAIKSCKFNNPNCNISDLVSQRNKLNDIQKSAIRLVKEKLDFLGGFSILLSDYTSKSESMLLGEIKESDMVSEEKRQSLRSVINYIEKNSNDTIKYVMDPSNMFSVDRDLLKIEKAAESIKDKNYMSQYNYLVLHFSSIACKRFAR